MQFKRERKGSRNLPEAVPFSSVLQSSSRWNNEVIW